MDAEPELTKTIIHLPKLMDIEEFFAAWSHVVMQVREISKGSTGNQGSILNMEHDAIPVANKLLLLAKDMPMLVARKNNTNAPGGCKYFKISF